MAYNKSPFKMAGKSPLMKQLLGNQGNLPMHLKEAIKASPAKQMGVDAGDTAAFEKSKEIESKFEKKIEKAGGFGVPNEDGSSKNKRVNRLTKRANKRQERKVPRARKKADEKGYDMNNMDGTTTTLKGKNQKASPAKQMKQDSTGTKDVLKGSPAKKYGHSPAKKYGKSPAKKHGMSPLKQRNTDKNGDGKVNINELIPEGLEQGKKLVQKGKKFINSIGKIGVFKRKTEAEKKAIADAKALKKKQREEARALKNKKK